MKQERKLFNQTEMAHKLGISKGTLSKWIIKNNVFPEKVEGNKKLYKETLIDEYRKSKDGVNTNHNKIKRESFSTIEFLKKQVEEKQETIENLQKKIDEKDKTIADFGNKFAKLADQAQQLNLTDKDPDRIKSLKSSTNKNTDDQNTSKSSTKENKKHGWLKWLFDK